MKTKQQKKKRPITDERMIACKINEDINPSIENIAFAPGGAIYNEKGKPIFDIEQLIICTSIKPLIALEGIKVTEDMFTFLGITFFVKNRRGEKSIQEL